MPDVYDNNPLAGGFEGFMQGATGLQRSLFLRSEIENMRQRTRLYEDEQALRRQQYTDQQDADRAYREAFAALQGLGPQAGMAGPAQQYGPGPAPPIPQQYQGLNMGGPGGPPPPPSSPEPPPYQATGLGVAFPSGTGQKNISDQRRAFLEMIQRSKLSPGEVNDLWDQFEENQVEAFLMDRRELYAGQIEDYLEMGHLTVSGDDKGGTTGEKGVMARGDDDRIRLAQNALQALRGDAPLTFDQIEGIMDPIIEARQRVLARKKYIGERDQIVKDLRAKLDNPQFLQARGVDTNDPRYALALDVVMDLENDAIMPGDALEDFESRLQFGLLTPAEYTRGATSLATSTYNTGPLERALGEGGGGGGPRGGPVDISKHIMPVAQGAAEAAQIPEEDKYADLPSDVPLPPESRAKVQSAKTKRAERKKRYQDARVAADGISERLSELDYTGGDITKGPASFAAAFEWLRGEAESFGASQQIRDLWNSMQSYVDEYGAGGGVLGIGANEKLPGLEYMDRAHKRLAELKMRGAGMGPEGMGAPEPDFWKAWGFPSLEAYLEAYKAEQKKK